ncbi:hypothetical protein D3C85_1549560 [compost metagenome]
MSCLTTSLPPPQIHPGKNVRRYEHLHLPVKNNPPHSSHHTNQILHIPLEMDIWFLLL